MLGKLVNDYQLEKYLQSNSLSFEWLIIQSLQLFDKLFISALDCRRIVISGYEPDEILYYG